MFKKTLILLIILASFSFSADKGWYGAIDEFPPSDSTVGKSYDGEWSINHVRKMLVSADYGAAVRYVNKLKLDSFSDETKAKLYHFKGVAAYFLVKSDKENFEVSAKSFVEAQKYSKKENVSVYSMVWIGILYETYSTDKTNLELALTWLQKVLDEYPHSRFANDAAFYKARILKKMGYAYGSILEDVKNGKGFKDSHVYSRWHRYYYKASALVEYSKDKK